MQLYNADFFDILPSLKNIDAIITDLPYELKGKELHWDRKIDPIKMWDAVKNALKPTGTFVTTCRNPLMAELIMTNLDWFKYDWVWVKERATGFAHCKNAPMKNHEYILVFSGGCIQHKKLYGKDIENRMTYNPQGLIYDPKTVTRYRDKEGITFNKRPGYQPTTEREYTNYPKSAIFFSMHNADLLHPTQKPVELYEYLIKTYTNEGETVVDICLGSGTTGIAAKNTNRNFIGIEKDKDFFEKAKQRLEQ